MKTENRQDLKNLYNIKELCGEFNNRLIGCLIPAMIVYLLKDDIYWALLTYGFILFMLQSRKYFYHMGLYSYVCNGEYCYHFIPEFGLRGVALAMIVVALTHFAGYSNLWVLVCGVGGLFYGYAMNFGVEMKKYNEVLRGIGVAMIIYAICVNAGVAMFPLAFFTIGSFLVAYHFWITI